MDVDAHDKGADNMTPQLWLQFATLYGTMVLGGATIALLPLRFAQGVAQRQLRSLEPFFDARTWEERWKDDPRGPTVRSLDTYRQHRGNRT